MGACLSRSEAPIQPIETRSHLVLTRGDISTIIIPAVRSYVIPLVVDLICNAEYIKKVRTLK